MHISSSELTIIVPAFNEEESLRSYLPELISFCEKNNFFLIVVNDGSSDKTKQILESHSHRNFFPVHHKLNRGYGGAIKSGVLNTQTKYLVTIDADGQHNLSDVFSLFTHLKANDADMVVGKRKGKSSAYRSFGKWLIRRIAKFLMKVPVHDLNSGIKIYEAALAKKYLHLCPDTMAYSDIITLVFISQRHKVLEKDVKISERIGGRSTISAKTAFNTVMEILNIVMLFNPSRVFIPLAAISFFSGLAWGIQRYIVVHDGISVGAVLAMITGILFFLLGLIAEQLSQIRRR